MATEVAFIVMVVRIMAALSIVVAVTIAAARLAIFGVIAALLVGVLGLVAMDVARFARKLRRRYSLRLVAFVVTIARHRDNCDCVRYGNRRPCSSSCRRTCFW